MGRLDIDAAWKSLQTEPSGEKFSERQVRDLPPLAQRYFRHAIAPGTPLASSVILAMTGSIKPGPVPWMRFSAHQILSPPQGFIWRVRARWGLLAISGEDYFVDGEGGTLMRLFGVIPMVTGSGPDVSRAAAGRLLAESVLVPPALLPGTGASWHEGDGSRLRIDLTAGQETTALTLALDDDGRVREVVIQRWGNQTDGGEYAYVPFGVGVDEEATFGGYTIPSRLRAGWWYGTDRYAEFFRARIKDAVFGLT